MLVTFNSPGNGGITLFGDVAARLLQLMGHSGTVPGALSAPHVQSALVRLEAAVAAQPPASAAQPESEDEDEEPAVSLRHRALPLIELLRAAARDGREVMWDHND